MLVSLTLHTVKWHTISTKHRLYLLSRRSVFKYPEGHLMSSLTCLSYFDFRLYRFYRKLFDDLGYPRDASAVFAVCF